MRLPIKCPNCQLSEFDTVNETVNNISVDFIVCNHCNSGIGVYDNYLKNDIQRLVKELKNTFGELKKTKEELKNTNEGLIELSEEVKILKDMAGLKR